MAQEKPRDTALRLIECADVIIDEVQSRSGETTGDSIVSPCMKKGFTRNEINASLNFLIRCGFILSKEKE